MAMLFTRRRIQTPRPVALFGEPIVWVDTARYLGVTFDKRLTYATHIDQVKKKASQRLGVLVPLLNRRSGLSIRSGVLLYRQLIRSMMDYACPVWRSAAITHVTKLQVLQSKCLRIATSAPWYMSNRQINEDLGVPFFADHIRALTDSFDSKLADAGNPLDRLLVRYLSEGWPKSSKPQAKGDFGPQLLRGFLPYLVDVSRPVQPPIEGHPQITGCINPHDWFTEESNRPRGLDAPTCEEHRHALCHVDGDPPPSEPEL
jgi:hypothetical protein